MVKHSHEVPITIPAGSQYLPKDILSGMFVMSLFPAELKNCFTATDKSFKSEFYVEDKHADTSRSRYRYQCHCEELPGRNWKKLETFLKTLNHAKWAAQRVIELVCRLSADPELLALLRAETAKRCVRGTEGTIANQTMLQLIRLCLPSAGIMRVTPNKEATYATKDNIASDSGLQGRDLQVLKEMHESHPGRWSVLQPTASPIPAQSEKMILQGRGGSHPMTMRDLQKNPSLTKSVTPTFFRVAGAFIQPVDCNEVYSMNQ
eukprot:GFYU01004694.1.p1 GENE.GFYU01004694.1~~GFYU01004694.1.p1  ORF type:complete len:262 (-),score=40.03 GFYU01004694.1:82-867(-)